MRTGWGSHPKYFCISAFFSVSSLSRLFWSANFDLSIWAMKVANWFYCFREHAPSDTPCHLPQRGRLIGPLFEGAAGRGPAGGVTQNTPASAPFSAFQVFEGFSGSLILICRSVRRRRRIGFTVSENMLPPALRATSLKEGGLLAPALRGQPVRDRLGESSKIFLHQRLFQRFQLIKAFLERQF